MGKLILSLSTCILRLRIFVLIKDDSTMMTQSSRSFMKSLLLLENNYQGADAKVYMGKYTFRDSNSDVVFHIPAIWRVYDLHL